MFTIGRAATGFVKDYLGSGAPNTRSSSPASGPASSTAPSKTTHPTPHTIEDDDDTENVLDSPLSDSSSGSEHSFAQVEVGPRGPHVPAAGSAHTISRSSTPLGLTESETDDLDDLDSDNLSLTHGHQAQIQTDAEALTRLGTHSRYPPLLFTGPGPHRAQTVQNAEQWRNFNKNQRISEWSVVRDSKKEMAELNRLREDYEAKLKEKDETIEKERTTWDWVRKDLVERQRQEMDELKERLEAEIDVLKNDLQETQCSLNAGNEELQVARETLKQNGADEAANLVAIDAGIQRLKSGYEVRLLEKDKAIDELRKTHEKERQEWAQTLRDAEKQMELKEEGWQEEKQQLRTEHEHQRKAFGYATQSNTNLIDKLRDDAFKTDALLDSRTKELEKTKSQLKKIQQKWKELQEKNRRTISSDTEQTPTSPQVKSSIAGSDNPPKLGLPRVAQDLPLSTHTFPLSATLSGNMTYEDVKRLLDTLNSEIFQFAAQFTDDIDQLRRVPAEMGQSTELIEGERVEALKEMASLLGNNIVEYLNSEPEREDCDAVSQCALQAILLHWCKRVVNMWAWNKEVNNALKDIYEGILAGNQDAAKRWRVVTRAQSRAKWEGEWNSMTERVSISVMKFLILVTRGHPISTDAKESKRLLAYQKLSSILEIAFQINKAIGEHITSADYEVFYPRPGDKFDARSMIDDNEQPVVGKFHTEEAVRQEIICTCHLGLRRIVRDISSSHGKHQIAVISKARVLLPSALTDWEVSSRRV